MSSSEAPGFSIEDILGEEGEDNTLPEATTVALQTRSSLAAAPAAAPDTTGADGDDRQATRIVGGESQSNGGGEEEDGEGEEGELADDSRVQEKPKLEKTESTKSFQVGPSPQINLLGKLQTPRARSISKKKKSKKLSAKQVGTSPALLRHERSRSMVLTSAVSPPFFR